MSCNSENTLTGRNGNFRVDAVAVARVTQWTVTPALATSNEWGDSDSGGYTNRSAGRRDATFTAEGKFDSSNEIYDIFQPEDVAACTLYLDASTLYWSFARALCTSFSLTVNIDSEEVIGWTSDWGADGEFLYPGAVTACA